MGREWGNPNVVGAVYEVTGWNPSHNDHRIREGDIMLCLRHTGDCHYAWARLVERKGNDTTRHFDIEDIYQAYGVSGKVLDRLDQDRMIAALIAMRFSHWSSVLIRRPDEEIRERTARPCPCCGEERHVVGVELR